MRQTIKELETNVAYRWFIGYDFTQPIPHFSTFGKNYARRFQDTDLFETIFAHILGEALKHRFVNSSVMFIDSTHVKANANKKKYIKTIVEQEPKKYLSYLIYYDPGPAWYYMGDYERGNGYEHGFPNASFSEQYQDGSGANGIIQADEFLEKYNIKMISWDYTQPIKNNFSATPN